MQVLREQHEVCPLAHLNEADGIVTDGLGGVGGAHLECVRQGDIRRAEQVAHAHERRDDRSGEATILRHVRGAVLDIDLLPGQLEAPLAHVCRFQRVRTDEGLFKALGLHDEHGGIFVDVLQVRDEFAGDAVIRQSHADRALLAVMEGIHAVKSMRDHGEPVGDCFFHLLCIGVRVRSRNDDALARQVADELHAALLFRCERDAGDDILVLAGYCLIIFHCRVL